MMGKEEQIEVMAKDCDYVAHLLRFNDPYMLSLKGWSKLTKEMIKLGWVKPPKDSVVLSGLELADYKHYKEYTKSLAMVEKEMAEKILNTEFFVFETENRGEEYQKGYMQAVRECRSRKDELAKQLNVKIKE